MGPRLAAIDGPLKGQVLLFSGRETTVGRERGNNICLDDLSVSRRHCVFHSTESGAVCVADRESRNGTFVNGLPVRERALEHGDEIRVGESVFVFLTEGEEIPEERCNFDDSQIDTNTLLRLRADESVYLRPEIVLASPTPQGRVTRALSTLLRISTAIHTSKSLDELGYGVLKLLVDAVPAEHGAILLMEPPSLEPVSVYHHPPGGTEKINRQVVERAAQEGIAVLTNSAGEGSETRSALAVPLFGGEKLTGVIYLDSRGACFDQDHLQLATAVGVMAGGAIGIRRRLEWLRDENERLHQEINLEHDMIGESPAMRKVHNFITRVAPTHATVLISGESGTGKELVARAVHRNSPRREKAFVAINCATLTETLLESELFGHEKGAFTGAVMQKKGKLEVATGGSVFLDEIGELPVELQAKLLRVLQEREVERVGGTRPIKVDIRLIAATNRDLRGAVAESRFREDLYYRLNVVSVVMPPLRDRREDVLLLANYFVSIFSKRLKRHVTGISPEARDALLGYDWPGNVRELENTIERALVLGSTDAILLEDLPDTLLEPIAAGGQAASYHEAVRREKKEQILQAIDKARGNYTEAAKILGVHPNYLHRLIRNLQLKATIEKRLAAG